MSKLKSHIQSLIKTEPFIPNNPILFNDNTSAQNILSDLNPYNSIQKYRLRFCLDIILRTIFELEFSHIMIIFEDEILIELVNYSRSDYKYCTIDIKNPNQIYQIEELFNEEAETYAKDLSPNPNTNTCINLFYLLPIYSGLEIISRIIYTYWKWQ